MNILRIVRNHPSARGVARRRSQASGFAYLMALFMVLAIVIASEVVVQNTLTLGRRDRESDMIWRGNQYVRAIRLYYRKTGHYPQSLDNLDKGLPELHFLRAAAYKDPMNTADGTWRFIYINGAGQIIGSVRYATLQQMAFLDLSGCPPVILDSDSDTSGASSNASSSNTTTSAAAGTSSAGANAQPNPCTQPNLNGSGNQPGQAAQAGQNLLSGQAAAGGSSLNPGQSPISGSSASASSFGQGFSPGQTPNPLTLLKPTGPVDEPVVGGFLTGVGSKVNKPSIKVYKGGKKYNQWEFIWNPIEDQARAIQQGLGSTGQQQPGQIGQSILNGIGAAGLGTGTGSSNGNASGGAANSQTPPPQPSQPAQPPQ